MQFILKNVASRKEIAAIEKKLFCKNHFSGFNAKKYNGVLVLKEDPLAIHLKLRENWERDLSLCSIDK